MPSQAAIEALGVEGPTSVVLGGLLRLASRAGISPLYLVVSITTAAVAIIATFVAVSCPKRCEIDLPLI